MEYTYPWCIIVVRLATQAVCASGIDRNHTQRTELREVAIGRKRHSIDLRDNDRGVTSFVVCVHGVGCHSAIAEVLLHWIDTRRFPSSLGTCGMETLEQNE